MRTPRRPIKPLHTTRITTARRVALALTASLCLGVGASAAELVVRVTGIAEPLGQVGCALFSGPAGFPMDNSTARQQWQAADPKGLVCRFDKVQPGTYVVSIGHDVNGNRKVDTNLVGMPTEQWGVSNNVRPALRAPRFDEAAFKVAADATEVVVDIQVAK